MRLSAGANQALNNNSDKLKLIDIPYEIVVFNVKEIQEPHAFKNWQLITLSNDRIFQVMDDGVSEKCRVMQFLKIDKDVIEFRDRKGADYFSDGLKSNRPTWNADKTQWSFSKAHWTL